MAISRVVNNLHVGKVEATFINDTTSNEDFTQTDLDNRLFACTIGGNNTVQQGNGGDHPLFGCVLAVDLEESSSIPINLVVGIYGIFEFKGSATVPTAGDKCKCHTGLVLQDATADSLLANTKSRGICTHVHNTSYIEVLL
jgi:DNA-binding transcriptional regulator LsrR (DeoR family)